MFWKSRAKESYDNLNKATNNVGRSNLALSIALVFSVGMNMTKQTEVIVMPNDFKEEIIMNGNKINQEYKLQWGLMIATLLGNITEKNANFIIERIVKMVPAELGPEQVEASMVAAVEEMKMRGVKQEFKPSDTIYSSVTDYVWVVGQKTTTSIKSGAADTVAYTYEIEVGVRNGRPIILDIQQFEGAVNPAQREREINKANKPRAISTKDTVIKYSER